MDINATLIGQMVTFALFVWFTMRFVWPLLENVLKERQEKISEGLMAAERGHKELELAKKFAVQQMHEAREKAAHLIEQAQKQATLLVEEAKALAQQEREQIVRSGKAEVERSQQSARTTLQAEVGTLVVSLTERLLKRSLTASDQAALLELKKVEPHD